MFTQEDREFIDKKGITLEKVEEQLSIFERGFPYLNVLSAATINDGIMSLNDEEVDQYIKVWDKYLHENKKIMKLDRKSVV